jgi:hypothetical protein
MKDRSISSIAKCLKELVFVWGTISAFVGGSIFYFNEYYSLFIMHSTELGLVGLTIFTSAVIWFTLSKKNEATDDNIKQLKQEVHTELSSIQKDLVRSDVDRWYKDHKDAKALTDDELKYLHYLKTKLEKYGVNSFSQSQVNRLLNKFDK